MKNHDVKENVLKRFNYSTDQAIDKPFNWKQMWRLLSYLKPYKNGLLPLAFLSVIIVTIIRLVIPILIGIYLIEAAIIGKDSELLVWMVSVIAVLYVI